LPDYLRVVGIPLLHGRFFSAEENEKTPHVVVVDEVFAATFFPGQDPIGKRIRWEGPTSPAQNGIGSPPIIEAEIIGIVGHVKQWGLEVDDKQQLRAQAYQNIAQLGDEDQGLSMGIVARTAADSTSATEAIRQSLRQLNGEFVVYGFRTMDGIIEQSLRQRRFSIVLLVAFAVAALMLAAVGIYGVVSYLVRERAQEIGIRMALGARRPAVLLMVVRQAARLAFAGLALGLVAEVPAVYAIRSLLFGVRAIDPLTFVAVTLILLAVALVACFLPAHRATRIDPMEALRCE